MSAFEAEAFAAKSRAALNDEQLRSSLNRFSTRSMGSWRDARAGLAEFDALRDTARNIKDAALASLDELLTQFEARVKERGGEVHWARNAEEARAIVLDLCRRAGAKTVVKSKSMVSEEIDLGAALEADGIKSVETDLGEYIIQLRGERPSHSVAPAIHLSKAQVGETFKAAHKNLPPGRDLDVPQTLVREARDVLREDFAAADVGITGANFLIAETGSALIVSNEGNADLTASLPKTHIVLTGIEKVVPRFEDVGVFVRLLARSAVGQEITAYTSVYSGPRQPGEIDGPQAFHVVLLDNGRSKLLGTDLQETLRCIRCAACLNHCPVFGAIGGHGYGSIYPGPIGAVLTPALVGLGAAKDLPEASTLCGRCEEVCPVRIPLPSLLRRWRQRAHDRKLQPRILRWGVAVWAWFAASPGRYRWGTGLARGGLTLLGSLQGRGWLKRLPVIGSGWTKERDMRIGRGATFQARWRKRMKAKLK